MELVSKFCDTYDCKAAVWNGNVRLQKGNRSVTIKGFGGLTEQGQRRQLILARQTLHIKQAA